MKIPIHQMTKEWKDKSQCGTMQKIMKEVISRTWNFSKRSRRNFLGSPELRVCLPMQGFWVGSLVREDFTCRRANKPVHHNYWSPSALGSVLSNKRSQYNEKPMHCKRVAPLTKPKETLGTSMKTQYSQKLI